MRYPKDCNIHRPPHTFTAGVYYFISARTYFALPYLRGSKNKQILLESIEKAVEKFSLNLFGWVILDNHYHLLLKLPEEDNKVNLVSLKRLRVTRFSAGGGSTFGGSLLSNKINLVSLEARKGDRFQPLAKKTDRLQSVRQGNELKLVSLFKKQNDRFQPVILGKIIGFIHGRSSRLLRKREVNQTQNIVYDFIPQEFALLKQIFLKQVGRKHLLVERKRMERFKQLIDAGDFKRLEQLIKNVPKIWYQYLDHIITNEADFYRHLNYIHQNPIKHDLCQNLLDYQFSSIHTYVKKFDKEWITDCFRKYPIIDFQPSFEDW